MYCILLSKKTAHSARTYCTHKIIMSQVRQPENNTGTQRNPWCLGHTLLSILYYFKHCFQRKVWSKEHKQTFSCFSVKVFLCYRLVTTWALLQTCPPRWTVVKLFEVLGLWSAADTAVTVRQLSEACALEVKPWKGTIWSLHFWWSTKDSCLLHILTNAEFLHKPAPSVFTLGGLPYLHGLRESNTLILYHTASITME